MIVEAQRRVDGGNILHDCIITNITDSRATTIGERADTVPNNPCTISELGMDKHDLQQPLWWTKIGKHYPQILIYCRCTENSTGEWANTIPQQPMYN